MSPYGGRGLIITVLLAVAAMQRVQTGINPRLQQCKRKTAATQPTSPEEMPA